MCLCVFVMCVCLCMCICVSVYVVCVFVCVCVFCHIRTVVCYASVQCICTFRGPDGDTKYVQRFNLWEQNASYVA